MEIIALRFILALYAIGALALTGSYLRYRKLTTPEYIFWGTLALIMPIFGPFFVIAARPGPRKRLRRPRLGGRR